MTSKPMHAHGRLSAVFPWTNSRSVVLLQSDESKQSRGALKGWCIDIKAEVNIQLLGLGHLDINILAHLAELITDNVSD